MIFLVLSVRTLAETVLWTNSSPTSDFAEQAITLDSSYMNYTYIGMYCNYSKSELTPTYFAMMKSSELGLWRSKYGSLLDVTTQIANNGSGVHKARGVARITDTSLQVIACLPITGGSGSITNQYLIPTKIVGLR